MKKAYSFSVVSALALYLILGLVGFGDAAGKGKTPPPPPPLPLLANSAIVYVDGESLKVADANGGNQATLVSQRGTLFSDPSWSPDGNFILFESDLNGPGIYSIKIDRKNDLVETPNLIIPLNTVITKAAWSPAPTPDAKYKIAYGYFDAGKYTIYLVDVEVDANGNVNLGTPFKLPTYLPEGLEEFQPSWSPDASKLAVTTYDASRGSWGINTFRLGTTDCGVNIPVCELNGYRRDLIAELFPEPSESVFSQYGAARPSWANKGNMIAVNGIPKDRTNGEIWVIEFGDDPEVTRITNLTKTNPPTTGPNGSADGNESNPTWSPDDSQIMYNGWDYLCAPQNKKNLGYNLKIRNVHGTDILDACEEKMIVEGGRRPNWWRNAPPPAP
jgi:WD40-like Beta Propeller Repeat